MKTIIRPLALLTAAAWIAACITSCASETFVAGRNTPHLSFHAGINSGGIVENTDMSVVPDAAAPPEANVDAFSGATHTGAHAGIHVHQPVGRIAIETGLDYMYNYQEFFYIDAGQFAMGQRSLDVSQLVIPLRLELPLFGRLLPGADMHLHIGYTGEFNLVNVQNSGILPDYKLHRWSNGASVGFSTYPFRFSNNHKLGFCIDLYRGSAAFEDRYNQPEFEMPGTSFFKAGVAYRFH